MKFLSEKKEEDDDDFLNKLSLLNDKFQGKAVFLGGNSAIVNLGEIEIVLYHFY